MAKAKSVDPFVCREAPVEVSSATSRIIKQRIKTADEGRLVSAEEARKRIRQWLSKSSTTKDALTDLEQIFDWSREKHPGTTEQFAVDLFDHIELLHAVPTWAPLSKGIPMSDGFCTHRSTFTTVWTRTGEQLKFCISGIAPGKILNFKDTRT
jgi:hypothetical protein